MRPTVTATLAALLVAGLAAAPAASAHHDFYSPETNPDECTSDPGACYWEGCSLLQNATALAGEISPKEGPFQGVECAPPPQLP